ncbi:MAG: hypothetical protein ACM3US_05575 [Sphingomonadaceae bacterium]
MTIAYAVVAASIPVIAFFVRGPRFALWTLFASALPYLVLVTLITRSMG